MNMVDSLAGGDPTKYEQITELPVSVVLFRLQKARMEEQFRMRLQEVYKRRAKMAAK